MLDPRLVPAINQSLEISLSPALSGEQLRQELATCINNLIVHDFEKLIFYLYRIDVDETKMRRLLDQRQGEDAAGLIADLVIERQLQKIRSRREFDQRDNDMSTEEKW